MTRVMKGLEITSNDNLAGNEPSQLQNTKHGGHENQYASWLGNSLCSVSNYTFNAYCIPSMLLRPGDANVVPALRMERICGGDS